MKFNCKRIGTLLFCVLFFCLCAFFSLGMLIPGASSAVEGAEMPKLITDGRISDGFGDDFETWFSKRFAFRGKVVDLFSQLKETVFATGNDQVIVGEDGFLFFDDTMDSFLRENPLTDDELADIAAALTNLNDYASERGAHLLFVCAPNKNTIYPEKMMSSMQEGEEKRIDQIYDYLAANTTVKTIDVRDALFAEKEANPNADLYYPLDTHWNNYGGFIAYQSIMDTVLKDFPTAVKHTADEYQVDYFDSHFKDCAYYLGYYDLMKSESPVYTMISGKTGKVAWHDGSGEFGQFVHAYIDPETGYQESCYNMGYVNEYAPDAPSLYIIRDSFFMAMSTFLRDSFSKVTSTWRTDFPTQSILKEDPDILIFECVEAQMDAVFGQKTLG